LSQVLQGEGLVGLPEIGSAARRLAGIAIHTPLIDADWVSERVDAQVRLKCESLQRGGAFKIRGAHNFVSQLSDEQVAHGLVTYSSGNHAQAVALAGRIRGVRVVAVMPTTTPKIKRDGVERYGGEVVYEGTTSVERRARAEAIAKSEGLAIVPPFDHRHIIAGQGTVGFEIAKDWPDVDTVLAPIGGGGLASGIAAAVKRMLPAARVIGVEPEGAASMRRALDNGSPIPLSEARTIADGLAPVIAGQLTFEHARELMDDVVTVSDSAIRQATMLLIEHQKLIVEYSGAAATAALLSGAVGVEGERVAVVVSGGNLDPSILAELI
jgi:threonine dehydratase